VVAEYGHVTVEANVRLTHRRKSLSRRDGGRLALGFIKTVSKTFQHVYLLDEVCTANFITQITQINHFGEGVPLKYIILGESSLLYRATR
jgi:hypothetical protein